MSELEQKFLKERNIYPRISFNETPEVKNIRILARKEDSFVNEQNEKVHGIKYLVEHEGVRKSFFTSSIGLVSKLAETKNGDMVDIKLGSIKTSQGFGKKYQVTIHEGKFEPVEVSFDELKPVQVQTEEKTIDPTNSIDPNDISPDDIPF